MKKFSILIFLLFFIGLSNCGIYKKVDARKTSVNVNDRVAKNMEEGRGISFGLGKDKSGGTFDFASSNELWRASMDVLDFVTFANASYSGGILITDWFNSDNKSEKKNRELKITVRFLSNEIRADGLEVSIHEKTCINNNSNSCSIKKVKSTLENEIKLAILKKATRLRKDTNIKRNKGKSFGKGRSLFKENEKKKK
jgi:hypothetical protein